MTGYCRKIGNAVCVTFANGDFTMLREDDKTLLPFIVHEEIRETGHYYGPIPESLWLDNCVFDAHS